MKLSDAIRKHLRAWEELEAINQKLAKRGMVIEAIPCYDPSTGSIKFSNARVIIDVKKAMPQLADMFIENGLPIPFDPTEADERYLDPEFFDVGEADSELSTLMGFDPSSVSDLEKFTRRSAGFDVVTEQPGENLSQAEVGKRLVDVITRKS